MSSAGRYSRSLPFPLSPTSLPNGYAQDRTRKYPPTAQRDIASSVDRQVHYGGGLRTPPAEDSMSTTYSNHPVLSNSYDSHVALARQPANCLISAASTIRGAGLSLQEPTTISHSLKHAPQSQRYIQPCEQTHAAAPASTASSDSATFTSSPDPSKSEGTVSRKESTMVTHSLQLPPCISSKGGSLDDFAASMTCFFWFESMDTIYAAENIRDRHPSDPVPPLSNYTEPCSSYKKWVNGILSTTQVTQNVVLLALLFVYRLKQSNPKVAGSPGSEYRLLTVALMLGNKFLDDNTYTNKTWAEVSNIPVKEIHVMEVEFLSNVRYNLLASKEQWQAWLHKLSCYHEYCDRARLEARRHQVPPMLMNAVSPSPARFASPLPSPTSILPSTLHSNPGPLAALSPASAANLGNQDWCIQFHPTPSISPHGAKPSLGLAQKRSFDNSDAVEPPPKRVSQQPQQPPIAVPSIRQVQPAERVRLPAPQLTVDTAQTSAPPTAYPRMPNYNNGPSVSLPPLGQGMRAMSTVYPTTVAPTTTVPATGPWTPQGSLIASSGPQTPSHMAPVNFGTPSKRHSPGGLYPTSSPLAEPFGTHTPISTSPSVYLQHRASPYKPIRAVNTLLYPPPSIPLVEYHRGSSQMHYQPLGRRNEFRSGIVPEFLPGHPMARAGIPTPSYHR